MSSNTGSPKRRAIPRAGSAESGGAAKSIVEVPDDRVDVFADIDRIIAGEMSHTDDDGSETIATGGSHREGHGSGRRGQQEQGSHVHFEGDGSAAQEGDAEANADAVGELQGEKVEDDDTFRMPKNYEMTRWSTDISSPDSGAAKLFTDPPPPEVDPDDETVKLLIYPQQIGLGKLFYFVANCEERWRYVGGGLIAMMSLIPAALSYLMLSKQIAWVSDAKAEYMEGKLQATEAVGGAHETAATAVWRKAWVPLVLLFIFGFLTFGMVYWSYSLFERAADMQVARLRRLYLKAALIQDFAWFDATNELELPAQIQMDCQRIRLAVGSRLCIAIQAFGGFVGTMVVSMWGNWFLTIVVLPAVAGVWLSANQMLRVKAIQTTRCDEGYMEAATIAEECFRSVRTLYSFTAERREVAGYASACERSKTAMRETAFSMGVWLGLQAASVYVFIGVALFFGRLQIYTFAATSVLHQKDAAQVIQVIFLVMQALIQLQMATAYSVVFADFRISFANALSLVKTSMHSKMKFGKVELTMTPLEQRQLPHKQCADRATREAIEKAAKENKVPANNLFPPPAGAGQGAGPAAGSGATTGGSTEGGGVVGQGLQPTLLTKRKYSTIQRGEQEAKTKAGERKIEATGATTTLVTPARLQMIAELTDDAPPSASSGSMFSTPAPAVSGKKASFARQYSLYRLEQKTETADDGRMASTRLVVSVPGGGGAVPAGAGASRASGRESAFAEAEECLRQAYMVEFDFRLDQLVTRRWAPWLHTVQADDNVWSHGIVPPVQLPEHFTSSKNQPHKLGSVSSVEPPSSASFPTSEYADADGGKKQGYAATDGTEDATRGTFADFLWEVLGIEFELVGAMHTRGRDRKYTLYVADVRPNSAADRAGISSGCRLVQFDNEDLCSTLVRREDGSGTLPLATTSTPKLPVQQSTRSSNAPTPSGGSVVPQVARDQTRNVLRADPALLRELLIQRRRDTVRLSFLDVTSVTLRARDVVFEYPTRPEKPVLRGMSFLINAGEKVAFIGGSGSGKSTVLQLLQRCYFPTGGSLAMSGFPLASIDTNVFRSVVGIVSQDPTLFSSLTIRENLLIGLDDATRQEIADEEILAICDVLSLRDWVLSLPQGVHSSGVYLSGGQKQRLSIGRAMLRKPAVLILDEATSALDVESEQHVMACLDGLGQPSPKLQPFSEQLPALQAAMDRKYAMTMIVVAHRLSTVENCDKIFVLKDGRVNQCGTHSELLQDEKGLYRGMIEQGEQDGGATTARKSKTQQLKGARAVMDDSRRGVRPAVLDPGTITNTGGGGAGATFVDWFARVDQPDVNRTIIGGGGSIIAALPTRTADAHHGYPDHDGAIANLAHYLHSRRSENQDHGGSGRGMNRTTTTPALSRANTSLEDDESRAHPQTSGRRRGSEQDPGNSGRDSKERETLLPKTRSRQGHSRGGRGGADPHEEQAPLQYKNNPPVTGAHAAMAGLDVLEEDRDLKGNLYRGASISGGVHSAQNMTVAQKRARREMMQQGTLQRTQSQTAAGSGVNTTTSADPFAMIPSNLPQGNLMPPTPQHDHSNLTTSSRGGTYSHTREGAAGGGGRASLQTLQFPYFSNSASARPSRSPRNSGGMRAPASGPARGVLPLSGAEGEYAPSASSSSAEDGLSDDEDGDAEGVTFAGTSSGDGGKKRSYAAIDVRRSAAMAGASYDSDDDASSDAESTGTSSSSGGFDDERGSDLSSSSDAGAAGAPAQVKKKETAQERMLRKISMLSATRRLLAEPYTQPIEIRQYLVPQIISSICTGLMRPIAALILTKTLSSNADVLKATTVLDTREGGKKAILDNLKIYQDGRWWMDFAAVGLITIGLLLTGLQLLQTWLNTSMIAQTVSRLRARAFRAVLTQEIAWHDLPGNTPERLCNLLQHSCAGYCGMLPCVGLVLQDTACVIGSLIVALHEAWALSLCLLAGIGAITVLIVIVASGSDDQANSPTVLLAQKYTSESIFAVRVLRALNGTEEFYLRFKQLVAKEQEEGLLFARRRAVVRGVTDTVTTLVFLMVSIIGTLLIIFGWNTGSAVFTVLFVFILIAGSAGNLAETFAALSEGKAGAAVLYQLMDRKPRVQYAPGDRENMVANSLQFRRRAKQMHKIKLFGSVSFEDVHFAYPSRPRNPILKGLNLTILRGDTVALCGPSGGGKSTVMQLILRFYDPNRFAQGLYKKDRQLNKYLLHGRLAGAVFVTSLGNGHDEAAEADGKGKSGSKDTTASGGSPANIKAKAPPEKHDLRAAVDLRSWRSLIGYVGQEPVLFDMSAWDNVVYGLSPRDQAKVTVAQVEEVAAQAMVDFLGPVTKRPDPPPPEKADVEGRAGGAVVETTKEKRAKGDKKKKKERSPVDDAGSEEPAGKDSLAMSSVGDPSSSGDDEGMDGAAPPSPVKSGSLVRRADTYDDEIDGGLYPSPLSVAGGPQGQTSTEEIQADVAQRPSQNQIGWHTLLGTRASLLSGGQRQRLSIARALLRKPQILMLDEATAALDNRSQREVQVALDALLERAKSNLTVITIAHRLSTIRDYKKIMVIKAGALVEQGDHDTLVQKRGGIYAHLYEMSVQEGH
eukprot:CAMPEP_0178986568 /NCGR_PEP_ID=MMETSP0795-20121207/2772_1 /TAXON_ID=88552 /ORGANISM="Amoebophrya sp., Strain Ameob2" /LENGTH=2579 /DNA_ID=CAMNT_0020677635 /DNA_START=27 /DNA_END=7765 /DNA_ORIENTATION=-